MIDKEKDIFPILCVSYRVPYKKMKKDKGLFPETKEEIDDMAGSNTINELEMLPATNKLSYQNSCKKEYYSSQVWIFSGRGNSIW